METRFEAALARNINIGILVHMPHDHVADHVLLPFFPSLDSFSGFFFYQNAQESLLSNDLFGNQSRLSSSLQFNLQFENYLFNRLNVR